MVSKISTWNKVLQALFAGLVIASAGTASAAFEKLGPFSYFMSSASDGGGSALVILIPPALEQSDSGRWSGIFVAASKKPMSIQELNTLDKLRSDGDMQFESVFLFYDPTVRAFTKLYLPGESAIADLPRNFTLNVGPSRVAKSSTLEAGAYVSVSAFESVVSFLDFQLVASTDTAESFFEAYVAPQGIIPYTVKGKELLLGTQPVTKMSFPSAYEEQNPCLGQDVILAWEGRTEPPATSAAKIERAGDLVFLRIEKGSALALTLSGIPVLVREDPHKSYNGEVTCILHALRAF